MKKPTISTLIITLMLAQSLDASWVYNPFTGKLDYTAGAGTNPFSGGGGTAFSGGSISCNTGSVSLSGGVFTYNGNTIAAAAATSQEFTIITALNGNARYEHAQISEHTQFTQGASITALKASIGRPGGSTDDEMLAQTALMVSSGDAWFAFDRPQPPILLSSNAYTLVLALRTTGGNVSSLTAGQVNYEVCGYAVQ